MTHNENIQDKKGVRLVQNVHGAHLPIRPRKPLCTIYKLRSISGNNFGGYSLTLDRVILKFDLNIYEGFTRRISISPGDATSLVTRFGRCAINRFLNLESTENDF